jgi:hypothetical protein
MFKVGFENDLHSGWGTWTVTVDYACVRHVMGYRIVLNFENI